MLTRSRSLLFTAALLCLGASSQAQTATYNITGVGSGSLNGLNFTNAVFSIVSTANTNAISNSGGVYTVLNTTATVNITGLGSALFTDVTQTADNQPFQRAGFGDNTNSLAILFDNNSAFASYNLSTSIGPVSGTSAFNAGSSFNTASGAFILNSVSGNVTFQATVTAVPEPGFIALLATPALTGAGFLMRRRRMARKAA